MLRRHVPARYDIETTVACTSTACVRVAACSRVRVDRIPRTCRRRRHRRENGRSDSESRFAKMPRSRSLCRPFSAVKQRECVRTFACCNSVDSTCRRLDDDHTSPAVAPDLNRHSVSGGRPQR
ncbi:hypothetical protein H310_10142 [Aphanomyces invadans]|uniref:Uncharacterized protein n=1 Tax=Aphanomyces invadans TaxID=157072 RepID=A0A024TS67_9STRA|nr:hypothetical protein H310_10142 [Aphanomyces invadans]ETV96858.1 hypothetical protein H310_10142 [Aphanomyces invadans]|eukprot:XP_008874635.1 hypothetical protein H310_10142 [Aphanomyces invadans]